MAAHGVARNPGARFLVRLSRQGFWGKVMGRPSLKTPELIEAICARLSVGEPLAAICRDDGMPALRPCYQWQEDDPDVKARFARAREIGFDAIALKALDIADERDEDPASRRVMVETRLKLLAKWDPKRYGEKLGIGQADGLEPMKLGVAVEFVKAS